MRQDMGDARQRDSAILPCLPPYNGPMTTLFISDLHLDPERPAIIELFGLGAGNAASAPTAVALIVLTLAPVWLGYLGPLYGLIALAVGAWFTWLVVRSIAEQRPVVDYRVFKGSVSYLSILFLAMLVDLAIPWGST